MDYYAKAEVEGYQVAKQAFDQEHASWEANEPQMPSIAPFVHTFREITEPTEINTAYGPAIVVPPSQIGTDQNGFEFAMSPEQIEREYVPVEDVTP